MKQINNFNKHRQEFKSYVYSRGGAISYSEPVVVNLKTIDCRDKDEGVDVGIRTVYISGSDWLSFVTSDGSFVCVNDFYDGNSFLALQRAAEEQLK